MLDDVFDSSPLADKFAGSLFAHTGNTGDVVRRIAPQGEYVAYQHRVVDAVFLADCGTVHNFDAVAILFVDAAVFADQLPVILVGCNHIYIIARSRAEMCQRADYVVGLETLDLQNRYAHRLDNPLDVGYRRDDVFGSGRTIGLVFGENIFAKRTAFRVESHAEQIGMFAFDDVAQEFGKPEDYRRVHAGTIPHRPSHECVVVFEYQCVGIDQKQFFHTQVV